jgi:hypothetical protein
MKNVIWAILVLILAAIFVVEFRYTLVINTPIVAKIDRLTGDVWIANSGKWLKVQHSAKEETAPAVPPVVQKAQSKVK